MKSFITRFLKFSIIPLILIVLSLIGYFIFDPFKVLYSYDSYSYSQANRDYITIETFKKNYPEKKYNSFIFGSSRALAFDVNSWAKHLTTDAVAYKMEGFSENIYGIYSKIKYLDTHNITIKNALIILDVDGTLASDEPQSGYIFRKHPDTTGDSWFDFHKEQFKAYFNANLILRYYMYKFGGVRNDFVYKYFRENTSKIDSITNDLSRPDLEYAIEHDPRFFDNITFYERDDSVLVASNQIGESVLLKLKNISQIFHKQNTNYRIVIGPIYSQQIYSREERQILDSIFGKENIYDFSGKNIFTDDKHYYYENFHYRPIVGDSIMNYIYSHNN